jgi:hypothetical protein
MRAARLDAGDKAGEPVPGIVGQAIAINLDAGDRKPVITFAGGTRVRIGQGTHDAVHTRADQRVGAGIPARAFMRARFKANIGSGSARCIAGCGESHRLCMRPPARLGPAAPDDNALRNDDAAN